MLNPSNFTYRMVSRTFGLSRSRRRLRSKTLAYYVVVIRRDLLDIIERNVFYRSPCSSKIVDRL
jgi:hypothetical protein